jgi:hypothetical protein
MNIDYKNLLPAHFNDDSRVWIYQSSRAFLQNEVEEIENALTTFASNWKSHGAVVKGFAGLFFNQFIIVMADETATGVSGCSTDSSVRLIKEIESLYKVDMFNRQNLAFVVKDKVQTIPLSQLNYALENKFIDADTLYFNNTVLTKKELEEKWIVPVKDSWLGSKIKGVLTTD